jgi:hypothetical protein
MEASARADQLQRQVAGGCLIAGALLMPLSSFFEYRDGMLFWAGVTGVLAYGLLAPGLLGLASLPRPKAPRLSVIGGLLLMLGAVGGTAFSTAQLFDWAEREAGTPPQTLEAINAIVEGRVFPVLVIFGCLLPIGLVAIAIGLFRTAVVPPWSAVLLGLGAVLFPVGHIGGIELVTHVADALLLVPFVWIALRLLQPTRTATAAVPA